MSRPVKYTIISLVVAAGLLCVIFGAIYSGGHECDTACKYGTEAVEVLEKYKSNDITAEETAKRLKSLEDELRKEEDKLESGEEDYHRIFMIRSEIISIQIELQFTNFVPYYEIDEAIEEIKSYF